MVLTWSDWKCASWNSFIYSIANLYEMAECMNKQSPIFIIPNMFVYLSDIGWCTSWHLMKTLKSLDRNWFDMNYSTFLRIFAFHRDSKTFWNEKKNADDSNTYVYYLSKSTLISLIELILPSEWMRL